MAVTCFVHQQAHCADCDRDVHATGPGELCGSYIGPAAKATAIYMRYQLNVSDRKISQFFADFFGLKFVAASAYGFERQAVRRGLPLYVDLLDKVRSLPVAHADEFRHGFTIPAKHIENSGRWQAKAAKVPPKATQPVMQGPVALPASRKLSPTPLGQGTKTTAHMFQPSRCAADQ